MATRLFDKNIVGSAGQALDFIESVLESSTEYSIIGNDLSGTILLWNEGARRLYGYEPEEVIGKANTSILFAPEDAAAGKLREIADAVLRDGKWEGRLIRVRKSGQRFTARVVITPRRDASGPPLGFLIISHDISDETRLTQELQATQFYTRSLIESSIDALMTTDPLGIITDVNRQMETLTGYSRDELIGTPFKDYFTDPKLAEDGVRLVLREGKVTNYELTARGKDGRETVVSFNASTFRDAAGKLQGLIAAARDITEQKNLERELRDSEAYNRGLIEASVDGLITVNPAGVITDVNEQMCRMTGYLRDELVGTPFADYFDDADSALRGVRETFERGAVTDYVLTLAKRDKTQLMVSFNASIFQDASGDVGGIFASARDITEQKRLEQQLRDQQLYTRSLIESSIDALMTTDPLGIITDVNQQMEALTGCSREELTGTPFKSYFTDPAKAEDGIKLVLREGRVTNYELTAHRRDGSQTVVSYNAATFHNRDGKLQGVFAAARDVTDRKRAEEELRISETRFRSIFEQAGTGMALISPEGRFLQVNPALAGLLGFDQAELERATIFDCLHPEHLDNVRRAFAEVQAGRPRSFDAERRFVRKDGTVVWMHVAGAWIFDRKSRPIHSIVLIHDITERKRIEEEIRKLNAELERRVTERTVQLADVNKELAQRNDELARASRMKSEFLARMSHELRTPMNAIVGFSDLLAEESEGQLSETHRRFVGHIREGAHHLLQLINDVLDLSRIEAGRIELHCEEFRAAEVLAEVLHVIQPLAATKGIRIDSEVSADLLVYADRTRFKQILYNLLSNATKFTPPGGKVWTKSDKRQDCIRFLVCDTGVGIPADELEAIFGEFHQVGTTTDGIKEGAGLGLAITKRLVEQHGGEIRVVSQPDRGSQFIFTLPATCLVSKA